MEPARAAAVAAEAQSARAAELLDTLSSLPGVSNVNAKQVKPASTPNHLGVSYRLRLPFTPHKLLHLHSSPRRRHGLGLCDSSAACSFQLDRSELLQRLWQVRSRLARACTAACLPPTCALCVPSHCPRPHLTHLSLRRHVCRTGRRPFFATVSALLACARQHAVHQRTACPGACDFVKRALA